MKTIVIASLAVLSLCVAPPAVTAGPRAEGRVTMDAKVSAAHDAGLPSRVLIRYRTGTGARLRERMRTRGIRVDRDHRGAGALSVALGAGELRRWAQDPDVAGISTDARVTAHDEPTSAWSTLTSLVSTDAQHLRRTLGLPAHAQGGQGVGIAVIDSGIAPMPDLWGRIAAFYDFTAGGAAASPSDAYGHGTHVAGLIAGSGALSLGAYPGIAPGARLIGLKVLDANGRGYASDVLNAIEFAIEHRSALGIDVINLSLGHPVLEPPATDPLVLAVERATAAGIVVVTSAGNFGQRPGDGTAGYGGITSPGNAPSAITVGALRTNGTADRADDTVAPYSSRGPTWYEARIKPDILAPGHAVIAITNPFSTLYRSAPASRAKGSYLALSGTSMATAVTSGVVALMVEANRRDSGAGVPLAPNTVKMLLQYTALAVGGDESPVPPQFEQGAGGLNAAGAIELARAIDPASPVGSHWLQWGVVPATKIAGGWRPWGQRIIWGDRMVWGGSIARHEPAWTSAVVWGDAVTWGPDVWVDPTSTVLDTFASWSTQVVWGDDLVATSDGEHIVWGSLFDDAHIVWGDSFEDAHIVWGDSFDTEHIVWGNSVGAAAPARKK
ncbi:MAG: S8 family peptidase [Vicinamibacterales bacterium]|jgi:serine protease AprX